MSKQATHTYVNLRKIPIIPGVQAKRPPCDKFLFDDMRAFSLTRRKQQL